MRLFVFLFLYGMLTLTGAFLSALWPRLAVRRWKELGRGDRHRDRYLFLCISFSSVSVGSLLIYAARTIANFRLGLSTHLQTPEAYFIGFGCFSLLLGFAAMVWVADLEHRRPRWSYGMIMITVVWMLICVWFTGGF